MMPLTHSTLSALCVISAAIFLATRIGTIHPLQCYELKHHYIPQFHCYQILHSQRLRTCHTITSRPCGCKHAQINHHTITTKAVITGTY